MIASWKSNGTARGELCSQSLISTLFDALECATRLPGLRRLRDACTITRRKGNAGERTLSVARSAVFSANLFVGPEHVRRELASATTGAAGGIDVAGPPSAALILNMYTYGRMNVRRWVRSMCRLSRARRGRVTSSTLGPLPIWAWCVPARFIVISY